MSLINKMLQDLDARGGSRGNAGQAVRSVTLGESSSRKVLAAGAGVAVVALAAAGWFGWKTMRKAPVAKPLAGAAAGSSAQPNGIAGNGGGAPGGVGATGGAGPMPASGGAAGGDMAGNASAVVYPGVAANAGPAASTRAGPASGPAAGAVSAINEASGAPPAVNPAAEASRAGRAARIEAGRRREAQEQSAADLAAQLEDAKRKAKEARAQAAALAAADQGAAAKTRGMAHGTAKAVAPPAEADQPAPRLAAKTIAAREGDAGGVTMTSQQQSDNAYKRALAALQEGRVPDAMANLEQAVYAYPRNDAARQALVGLLLEAHRNEEATRQLQLGLGLDPKQQQMAMLLARLQIEKGGPAVETLMRTLPYAGNNPDYLAFLAGALQKAQRHREAVEQYQAALRLMPQNGVWWMGMGISLQADRRNTEAVEAYQRARASGSLSPELASFVERKLAQLAR